MDHLTLSGGRPARNTTVIPHATDNVRRIIVVGLLLTLAMLVLQAASQAIDFGAFNLRIRAFNADKHDSVFGIASLLAQLALAAAVVWRVTHGQEQGPIVALRERRTRRRVAWILLAAIVACLVLVRGLTTFNAKALALPLASVFLLLCWLTWRDSRPARLLVWAGLVVMVASLVLHKVGLAADASTASDFTWAYQITGMVKHGAELAGWMLLAIGVTAGREGHEARETTPARPMPHESALSRPLLRPSARELARRVGL